MTITIINLVEKRKTLEVDASDTVKLVKARIEDQEGIPERLQRLMFADDVMRNTKALSDCGVREGDTLRLLLDMQNIHIFVETLTGKTLTLKIERSSTVEQVKDAIFKMEGIPIDEQRLIFKQKQLKDHESLSDYDIMDGDTIQLILRLLGSFHLRRNFLK